jgi:adenylosuccinate synthase
MPVIALIGGQWGDEGKGKIVDMLAEQSRLTVRFSGGDNAGHTVINPSGEFRLHLVPSGIFHPGVSCIIGNGVVVNPEVLLKEMEQLQAAGVKTDHLYVSERAHIIMPYHLLFDALEEERLGARALGTTRRGIGPAFADKVARHGIRACDLLDKKVFLNRLSSVLESKNTILTRVYGVPPLSVEAIYSQYVGYGERLAHLVRDTEQIIHDEIRKGSIILLEGAQGSLLDVDFGTYPYVTSSSPLAGNGCIGAGIGPRHIKAIIGVFKAYSTRVGSGPMPTELKDEIGQNIRERAQEFGATTGRPRRCGWFDGVASCFTARLNGFTGAALTRLDILDTFSVVKICVGYRFNGETLTNFPSNGRVLEECQPIYEELEGWQAPTSHITEFARLPLRARRYIRRLEELISCPVSIVSVGPRREQTIQVRRLV